jgi:hypothetical protein
MRRRVLGTVATVLLAATLVAPSTAQAATSWVYVGSGVRSARLGMTDTKASRYLGRVRVKKRDNSYAGQVVYLRCFGPRSGGKYALQMYSNRRRQVFAFVINGTGYKTRAGIRVGSSESTLMAAYGASLKANPGPVYNRYSLGGAKGTDFYVSGGVVRKIVVRSF